METTQVSIVNTYYKVYNNKKDDTFLCLLTFAKPKWDNV